MTALYTLGILSTSFMRNAFPTVLNEFPNMLSTCWLLFLHSAIQLIPNHLNWVEVGWLWRPGHLMQHHPSPSWSNSPYTAWRCVLGHCPVEKQMIVPLRRIAAECCGMLWQPCWLCVPWIRNNSQTVSPAKHHHTSSSMLHGGNHTCRDHPITYPASHKNTVVGTTNLKLGLIRSKDRFSLV